MEKFQLFTNGVKGDCLGLFKEAEEKMGLEWWGVTIGIGGDGF